MMIIRPETPHDYPAIYRLVTAAFATTPHAEGDEQDFVERQRQSGRHVRELSLVAETKDALVAHLMMTRLGLNITQSVLPVEIPLLAAVAVEPRWQNQGIGSHLVGHALARAVLVVGDPPRLSIYSEHLCRSGRSGRHGSP